VLDKFFQEGTNELTLQPELLANTSGASADSVRMVAMWALEAGVIQVPADVPAGLLVPSGDGYRIDPQATPELVDSFLTHDLEDALNEKDLKIQTEHGFLEFGTVLKEAGFWERIARLAPTFS
jgi:hypothetical protein